MNIKYLPNVYSPEDVTEDLVTGAFVELVKSVPVRGLDSVTLGYDTQYDRTVDESGKPGEYIQFYIMWGDVE